MNSVAQLLGMTQLDNPLRDTFLRWQCRVRQIAMRENMGHPDDAITPELTLPGETEPTRHIITVLSKAPPFSKTPELQHMVKRTHDPAQRREKAVRFFSEIYYQKELEWRSTWARCTISEKPFWSHNRLSATPPPRF